MIDYEAVVITPTTGKDSLKKAIDSVKNQVDVKVKHLIVVDGNRFRDRIDPDLKDLNFNIDIVQLADNTGADGFYGHRIYAGFAHLVKEPNVLFLDEDNTYEPNHVRSCINALKERGINDFSYSLRNIYDKDGNFLCRDNCESLGIWPIFTHPNQYHIDTSAYCFDRKFLIKVSSWWHHGYGGDRIFFSGCRQIGASYQCSGKYTLNYYLDGNPNSASPDFFKLGNERMSHHYNNRFPWSNE